MRTEITLMYTLVLTSILCMGCKNGNNQNILTTNDTTSTNTTLLGATITAVDQYRLHTITGKFAPHGGIYKYDSSKMSWCEQPMAADIMSYMQLNEIANMEDLPDLNNYFSEDESNAFNSCIIKVTNYGNFKDIAIQYNGKIIYEKSFDATDERNNNIEFEVKNLAKFNLPQVGSMDYSKGKNYIISIGERKTNITFTNEIGEYELEFLKINKTSKNITMQGVGTVIADRAYFHTNPDELTKRKAFVITGQQIRYTKNSGDFVFVIYYNSDGEKTEGWIKKSELAFY
jgi:hypothetical protein